MSLESSALNIKKENAKPETIVQFNVIAVNRIVLDILLLPSLRIRKEPVRLTDVPGTF